MENYLRGLAPSGVLYQQPGALANPPPKGILESVLRNQLPMEGRLTFLPAMVNNGQREWALPGILASAWNAFTAPARAYSGNMADPMGEAMNFAGMMNLGAMPSPAAGGPGTLGMNVYHGSPHKFDPEKLVQLANGEKAFVGGRFNTLKEVPQGAKVLEDFPYGRFREEAIGTGEGAQAYGYGPAYLAESHLVGEGYKRGLSQTEVFLNGKKWEPQTPIENAARNYLQNAVDMGSSNPFVHARTTYRQVERPAIGSKSLKEFDEVLSRLQDSSGVEMKKNGFLYKVDLPDEQIAKMLDWDKPLSQQPEAVRSGVKAALQERGIAGSVADYIISNKTGRDALSTISRGEYSPNLMPVGGDIGKATSELLKKNGVPGIRYLDGGSRAGGKGTSNFVVFDDQIPKIIGRE